MPKSKIKNLQNHKTILENQLPYTFTGKLDLTDVHLPDVYLPGVHPRRLISHRRASSIYGRAPHIQACTLRVYISRACISRACISRTCISCVCLIGVYLTGVHLMGVHLIGMYLEPGGALPEIPCLCEPDEYDKQGFFGYPSRRGWTIDFESNSGPVRSNGNGNPSAVETGACLQTWLFFGMMHKAFQMLEVKVELEDCVIRNSNGTRRCITTFPLRQYFVHCLERGKVRSKESRKTAVADIARLLRRVDVCIRRYMDTLSPMLWRMS
jgi:hypothetical protein